MVNIGNDWDERLKGEWDKPYYTALRSFLADEYRNQTIYPPAKDIFNALRQTPYQDVKAVILGQDPYHGDRQAQGLSFSVPDDVSPPPSLINILKELDADLGIRWTPRRQQGSMQPDSMQPGSAQPGSMQPGSAQPREMSGILVPWTRQGVLLLNTVLTVRAHQPASHKGRGWEQFTDRVIELLAAREQPLVFILWGAHARAKTKLILDSEARTATDTAPALRHLIIQSAHPSPLSAHKGFFGGRYFSRTNYFLEDNGIQPIDWSL